MSTKALDHIAETVFTKMTGNELFPNPIPALTELETNLADYRSALPDAALGGKHATEVRNQRHEMLARTLRSLALHVQQVADGDAAVILSAGFDHNKTRQPNGPCPKPMDVQVINGPVGSRRVTVKVKPNAAARGYRFAYRVVGSGNPWVEVFSYGSSRQLQGLERFTEYEFRAVYVGTDTDRLDYSDPVTAAVV